MQTVKVDGLTYNWATYKTLNFKEIHGLNFDNNEIEVLEIKGTDFDFHVVIRIDTSQYITRPSYSDDPNWLQRTPDWPENYYVYFRSLASVLVLGTKFSKKYDIAKTGIRLFIDRPRVRKLHDEELQNKHVEKFIQFINSNRFKPYITNSSGHVIVRNASKNEVVEISP